MWKVGGFRIVTGEQAAHCPRCNSSKLRRTHRIGVLEKTVSKILDLHPYRCKECDDRFFRIRTRREPPDQPQTLPSETPKAFNR
jgi:DNA-directed RNA polymerase subunit RPC12/RpoP